MPYIELLTIGKKQTFTALETRLPIEYFMKIINKIDGDRCGPPRDTVETTSIN